MIRLQFVANAIALRSYCRRFCKLGDLVQVVEQQHEDFVENQHETSDNDDSSLLHTVKMEWQRPDETVETAWQEPRLVVHVGSEAAAAQSVQVLQRHYWSMPECQRWQRTYLPIGAAPVVAAAAKNQKECSTSGARTEEEEDPAESWTGKHPPLWMDQPSSENHHVGNSNSSHHGGGLGKRMQGQYLASFLLHMMAQKIAREERHSSNEGRDGEDSSSGGRTTASLPDPSQWAQQPPPRSSSSTTTTTPWWLTAAIARLNAKGVWDVAGGSGHVSMALSLWGVQSTVVDPRENVGRLPKRDRKIYHRALKQQQQQPEQRTGVPGPMLTSENALSYCQPVGGGGGGTAVLPFGSLRAWFGAPPDGVDTSFRHPDQANIPVVDDDTTLSQCSAIVALHPDEATDAIVDTAVRLRIPFIVVPCCVFFRLFPHRRKPSNQEPVSTYQDLLDYLMAKDESIQRTTLPFEGANTILWSYFGKEESSLAGVD